MSDAGDLTPYNTLGLSSRADAVKPLAYLPDLVFALDHAAETGQPFHVIGGGEQRGPCAACTGHRRVEPDDGHADRPRR
ncbi:hypothetical protein [Maritimibacter harenae]|uniref:hypothetical protein n=1 Tax=Maritimibacter harenae TaxID=2606218 RepID=UPI0019270164|nr:hypothetical protein [Maritimibacter harenae]